jgi:hypothetical protein
MFQALASGGPLAANADAATRAAMRIVARFMLDSWLTPAGLAGAPRRIPGRTDVRR